MLTGILILLIAASLPNEAAQESGRAPIRCPKPAADQGALIQEAETNHYVVRRVEFLGNQHIRDRVLRRRIILQEGDVFTRRILLRSLANVSRLKIIYPARLRDVAVSLDRSNKEIDMNICFREKTRAGGR